MYGDSYVVNLFKQNVYHKKNDIFATVTLKQQFFVTDSLTIVTAQIVYS